MDYKSWYYQKKVKIGTSSCWINLISVLNYRLEEFKRLNTLSKKVSIPPEKAMTRINFHRLPARSKPPKPKVKWASC